MSARLPFTQFQLYARDIVELTVIVVPASAMVYKVILHMRQKRVRRVAVVHDDGTLTGLLTQRHILAYARRLL